MPINPVDLSAMTPMGAALQPVDDKSVQLQQGELLTADSITVLTEKLGVVLSP